MIFIGNNMQLLFSTSSSLVYDLVLHISTIMAISASSTSSFSAFSMSSFFSKVSLRTSTVFFYLTSSTSDRKVLILNTKKLSEPAGDHSNSAGHSKSYMKVLILEKLTKCYTEYRKERESHILCKFNTFYAG